MSFNDAVRDSGDKNHGAGLCYGLSRAALCAGEVGVTLVIEIYMRRGVRTGEEVGKALSGPEGEALHRHAEKLAGGIYEEETTLAQQWP